MGRKRIDLTGKKYNHLTVIKLDHVGKRGVGYWLCQCDCGNKKVVNGHAMKNGSIKACGCLQGSLLKYQYSNKKIYKKWQHMISRCNNSKDISFKNYGGRGIKVCNEWLEYDNFAKWSLENGFKEGLELDRIDVNGDYEPNNCRYITQLENRRNKRRTLKYEYNGQEMTLKEISELIGVAYATLWKRIKVDKMPLEKAFRN